MGINSFVILIEYSLVGLGQHTVERILVSLDFVTSELIFTNSNHILAFQKGVNLLFYILLKLGCRIVLPWFPLCFFLDKLPVFCFRISLLWCLQVQRWVLDPGGYPFQ